MGLLVYIQGFSAVIALMLMPFLCRNHNLGLWIIYLLLCTYLTPIIGYPIYKMVFDKY